MDEMKLKVTQYLPQADEDSEEEKQGGIVMNANHAPNDPVSDDRADSDDGIDLLDDDFTMT